MSKGRSGLIALLVVSACVSGAASVLAQESGSEGSSDSGSAAAPTPAQAPTGNVSPGVPQWTPGEHYDVVPRSDAAWDKLPPAVANDPDARLCVSKDDGRYMLVMTTHPADPANPYPPIDTDRPC